MAEHVKGSYSNADLTQNDVRFNSKCGDKTGPNLEFRIKPVFKNFADMKKSAVAHVVWACQNKLRTKKDYTLPRDRIIEVDSEGYPTKGIIETFQVLDPEQKAMFMEFMKAELLKELKAETMKTEIPVEEEIKIYSETQLDEEMSKSELLKVLSWYDLNGDFSVSTRKDLIQYILMAQGSNDLEAEVETEVEEVNEVEIEENVEENE